MKDYKGYILDIDGVVSKGNEKIESTINFINKELRNGKEFYYITNNSTKSQESISEKLKGFGIKEIINKNIITSGMVTKEYLKKHLKISCKNNVLCLTEDVVKNQLKEIGCNILKLSEYRQANFVVVGETDFTRDDLYYPVNAIKHYGAFFIATNGDVIDPCENGESKPVSGAILAYIKSCTMIEPKVLGKPYPDIYEMIFKQTKIKKSDFLMIGDRLDTDIIGAKELEIDTMLIETGIHKKEDCDLLDVHPTYIINSLDDLIILD